MKLSVREPSTALANKLTARYENFKVVQLESALFARQVVSAAHTAFRLELEEGMPWILELEPSNLGATSYELVALTPNGEQRMASRADFLYKGVVNGGGAVRLAIKDGFIYGSITVDDQEYFIEPVNRLSGSNEKDVFLIYQLREDVTGPAMACGYKDESLPVARVMEKELPDGMSVLGDGDCFRMQFVPMADYSIYQKFGGDIKAVEAALLGVLNLAEGAFTTLNLGTDGSTDMGKDLLQFEVQKIVVATCASCDIVSDTENSTDIGSQVSEWIGHSKGRPAAHIFQFWTTRELFQSHGNAIAGTYTSGLRCSSSGLEILRYASDDPAFLRVLVAHETGHVLGCPHDNDMKSSVRSFIMYSSAGGNHKRFSNLADFGGGSYSSHLRIRETVLDTKSCLQACTESKCAAITGIQVRYFDAPDSVEISWNGPGRFLTRYKLKDAAEFEPSQTQTIDANRIVLKGLQPCRAYNFEIERICVSGENSIVSTVFFAPSSLSVSAKPINSRGDRHDLELTVDCRKCSAEPYLVAINKKNYEVSGSPISNTLVIKDLFSDGAVHRVEVRKQTGEVCKLITSYRAPYYRTGSTRISGADFNECKLPDGWKDTLLAKAETASPDARWYVAEKNFYSSRSPRGNFDSTCMLFYSRLITDNVYSGALSLTSPVVDLTPYKDVKLHFDLNFLSYRFPVNTILASLTAEVFDGTKWVEVFKKEGDDPWPRSNAEIRPIWDSIPSRVFIDLEPYKNKNFRLRFIADDGSIVANRSVHLFIALDNIRIDGYKDGNSQEADDFIVFPNPTNDNLYIAFHLVPVGKIEFRLLDIQGRLLDAGILNQYKVSMRHLSAGMYLLQLFRDGKPVGTRKIQKISH